MGPCGPLDSSSPSPKPWARTIPSPPPGPWGCYDTICGYNALAALVVWNAYGGFRVVRIICENLPVTQAILEPSLFFSPVILASSDSIWRQANRSIQNAGRLNPNSPPRCFTSSPSPGVFGSIHIHPHPYSFNFPCASKPASYYRPALTVSPSSRPSPSPSPGPQPRSFCPSVIVPELLPT